MALSCNRFCSVNAIRITYSESVFGAFGIQHTMRDCRLWPARLYSIFPPCLVNGKIFEKDLLNIKCEFLFSQRPLSETFVVIRRTELDMIKNV